LTVTPVAQRQRRLLHTEMIAGSSPAGGTERLRRGLEPGCQHGLISRPTPVQIRPPQLDGLEVLRPHAALVSAEDRVRPPAGPLLGCSSNRKTPPSQGGNRGAIPRRSTRSGGRKAVIRPPWERENVGSTPTPLTDMGLWSNGKTPAWRAGDAGSTPAGSTDRRRVAGYGLPGRFAKPCGRKAVRVQIPRLPPSLPRW
jgi:hypothetical protein